MAWVGGQRVPRGGASGVTWAGPRGHVGGASGITWAGRPARTGAMETPLWRLPTSVSVSRQGDGWLRKETAASPPARSPTARCLPVSPPVPLEPWPQRQSSERASPGAVRLRVAPQGDDLTPSAPGLTLLRGGRGLSRVHPHPERHVFAEEGSRAPEKAPLGQLVVAAETSLPPKCPEGSGRRTCDRPKETNYFLTRGKHRVGEGDPRPVGRGVPRLEAGPQRPLGDPSLASRAAEGPGQPGPGPKGLTAPTRRPPVTHPHAPVANVAVTVERERRGGHVRR